MPGRDGHVVESHTPQLRHLSLNCGGVYLRSLSLEWHRLTDLEVSAVYVDECIEVLRRTPDLINFAVYQFYDGDDGYPEPSHPIELNSLESIVLNSSLDSFDLALLFKNLIIPKAKKFKYLGMSRGHSFPVAEFGALLNRSGCSLTDLSFAHTLSTEADLFAIFSLTPSLRSLTFVSYTLNQDSPSLTDNFWSSLNPSITSSPRLLPQLEYFKFGGPLNFTWKVMLETVDARHLRSLQRLGTIPGFKSLSFMIRGLPFTLDPDIKLRFELLKAAGLHLDCIQVD